MTAPLKITITKPELNQQRADRALAAESGMSRSQIQRLMGEGKITCGGSVVGPNLTVTLGQDFVVVLDEPRATEVLAEDLSVPVLYEDEHLIIVNKPPRMSVHPSDSENSGTLVNALMHQVRDLSGIGGEMRPGIVHRIDKDTSGALLIAKNDKAHQLMSEIFSRHDIDRRYWAICYGAPSWDKQRVENYLGRNPKDRKKIAVLKEPRGGAAASAGVRRAVSHFTCVERFHTDRKNFASLIEAKLETGRTHQVRVHLTGLGFSVVGDPVYGTPTAQQPKWKDLPVVIRPLVDAMPGQALHARTLGFQHPITGVSVFVEAPSPPAFSALLEALRKDYL